MVSDKKVSQAGDGVVVAHVDTQVLLYYSFESLDGCSGLGYGRLILQVGAHLCIHEPFVAGDQNDVVKLQQRLEIVLVNVVPE